MKLQGEVIGKKVFILIDSGASHNFISKEMVHSLGLAVEETRAYSVKLGDGFKRSTRGCCKDMRVKIEDHIIKEIFYLFELGRVYMILGIAWLAMLRDVRVIWKTLTMTYHYHG